jgi:hypothetical protein
VSCRPAVAHPQGRPFDFRFRAMREKTKKDFVHGGFLRKYLGSRLVSLLKTSCKCVL